MTLNPLNMRMPTLKIELIYMADGLFLYKTEDGYVVKDQNNNILKESKTSTTCSNYITKTLESRRSAEREAKRILAT